MNALDLIEEMYWRPSTTILIDPPYYRKGKQLYVNYYVEDDHEKLSWLLDNLYKGFSGADIILIYDNEEYIKKLYWYPKIERVRRSYSV